MDKTFKKTKKVLPANSLYLTDFQQLAGILYVLEVHIWKAILNINFKTYKTTQI